MKPRISVPVKVVGGDQWAELHLFGLVHEICGEEVKLLKENFTFAGQHRVRLYKFKKNVHWKVPLGTKLDIEAVVPGRKQGS